MRGVADGGVLWHVWLGGVLVVVLGRFLEGELVGVVAKLVSLEAGAEALSGGAGGCC